MAFFKRKRKTKLFMVTVLIITMIATYGMPLSVYASEVINEPRTPTMEEADQTDQTDKGDAGDQKPSEQDKPVQKPSVPSEPEGPSVPSEPEGPSVPSEPEGPSVPSEPEEPSVPSEPEGPSVPSEPEGPSVPSESEGPSVPSESELTTYVVAYETSEGDELLPDKVVADQMVGTTVTETAIEITEYSVDESEKSITLAEGDNLITFIYTETEPTEPVEEPVPVIPEVAELTSYTVQYLLEDGEELLGGKSVSDQTVGDEVTEEAAFVEGYEADEESKSITLEADNNVLTFVYEELEEEYIEQPYDEIIAPAMMLRAMALASTEPDADEPGAVFIDKQAEWVDKSNGQAKVILDIYGNPIQQGADVLLILDCSRSMAYNNKIDNATAAAKAFVNKLYQDNGSTASDNRISLITFSRHASKYPNVEGGETFLAVDDQVSTGSQTKDAPDYFSHVIDEIKTGIWTNYEAAFQAADRIINGRVDDSRPIYIVFMSDGEPNWGRYDKAEKKAASLKSDGVAIYSLGFDVGDDDFENYIEPLASTPKSDYARKIEATTDLTPIFEGIAGETMKAGTGAVVTDLIQTRYFEPSSGASYSYEASHGTVEITNDGKVTWNIGDITATPKTLTIYIHLKNSVTEAGLYPTNISAAVEYTDYNGDDQEKVYPIPTLDAGDIGQITMNYYLVNGDGEPIALNGNPVNFDQRVSLESEYFTDDENDPPENLSYDKVYTVEPPSTIVVGGVTYVYVAESSSYGGSASSQTVTLLPNHSSEEFNYGYMEQTDVTVTFDENYTGAPDNYSRILVKDTALGGSMPSDPARGGYVFQGWNTEEDGNGTAFTAGTTVSQDLTVFAQWSQDQYTVTYQPGAHGTFTEVTTSDLVYGDSTPAAPATPGEPGYTFTGWTPEVASMVTGNATYVAQWSQDQYTVTYQPGAHGTFTEVTTSDLVYGDSTPAAPATPGEPGYTFTGWTPEVASMVTGNATYVAQWSQDQYTVTYQPGAHGTFTEVTTSDLVYGDSTPAAPATPGEPGYTFTGWTPEVAGTVTGNATYVAQWSQDQYTVTYQPGAHGTFTEVTTSDLVYGDSTPAAPATPGEPGYTFTGWTPEVAGTVTGNATYVAQWFEDEDVTINYEATAGGSVDPEDETLAPATGVAEGSSATADAGYHFVNWTDAEGVEVSTDADFIPAKSSEDLNFAATYTANFAENEDVTIYYEATAGGSVDPEDETLAPATGVAEGSSATADAGYHFVNWTDAEGVEVSTDADFIPAKSSEDLNFAATYTANFAENEDVTIYYEATAGGSVDPEDETLAPATGVAEGSSATADAGYHFVNWTDAEGVEVSTDADFIPAKSSEDLNFAATYTANFAENEDVTIYYEATAGGSVDPEDETLAPATGVAEGSSATADAGYHFVNWTDAEGVEVSTDADFIPAKSSEDLNFAATYTANFAENEDVTIYYEATAGGSVDPEDETLAPATGVAEGSSATADAGYHFVNWTDAEGVEVSKDASFVPAKSSEDLNFAATYTANFAEDEDVTINYEATAGGSVDPEDETLAPATGVAEGSSATADAGYHFVNWTNADNNEVSTDTDFIPAKSSEGLNVAATYTANFAEDEDVTINYEATEGGSVEPEDETLAPATGTATGSSAKADAGYHFVNWTDADNNEVSTDPNFIPAKSSEGLNVAATYTANFAEDEDVTINYEATAGGSVEPEDETLAPATGTATGSSAKADAGYHFVNWTDAEGVEVSTDADFIPAKSSEDLNFAATYTANFAENEDVTIYYEATAGGSVDPEDETLAPATGVAEGSSATADAGYHFVNWTDAEGVEVSTDADFIPAKSSEDLNFAATYTANFAENEDVTIYYEATAGGSVDPEDETLAPATGVAEGSSATADAGYHFVNWTDAEGVEVSTDADFIPAKSSEGLNLAATYTANFAEDEDVTINYEATAGGSVDPEDETLAPATGVAEGSSATADAGYHFVNWTDAEGVEVSTDADFIPAKSSEDLNFAATYTANFAEDEDVTINYEATAGGSVDPEDETLAPATGVAEGSSATADAGYHFVNWTDAEGVEVSTDADFIPAKSSEDLNFAATYTANFAEDEDVTINYEATAGGSVDPEDETLAPATGVAEGSSATADAGYHFVNWTDAEGVEVSTDADFIPAKSSEDLNFAATYTANFAEDEDVTINYEATAGGSVDPEDETLAPATGVAEGSSATADAGYHFVNWTDAEGVEVSTDADFIPAKSSEDLNFAATYTANFAEDEDVTINYEATAGGSVDPEDETLAPATGVAEGSSATADAGYHFVNWTDAEGVEVSTDADFIPAKSSEGLNLAATYTANFAEDEDVTIYYEATEGGSVDPEHETLAPATGVAEGSSATADAGYHFVNWTNSDNVEVSKDASFVPAKSSEDLNFAATYTANFAEDEDVTIYYEATEGGSVDPEDETLAPATGTATGSSATADAGYHFVNWTDADNNVVGTDPNFIPAKSSEGLNVAATYTANFAEDEDVTIYYEATEGGSVDPEDETLAPATGVAEGSSATAKAGYHFVNWIDADNIEVSTDADFIPAKSSEGLNFAATYTANFAEDEDVTIYYEVTAGGSVDPEDETLAPATGVAEGSSATADAGYHFVNWTDAEGVEVSTDADFIPAKSSEDLNFAATYTANFAEDEDVTIYYEATEGGSVDPEDETLAPATGTATGSSATADAGYHFVNWTDAEGVEVSTDADFIPAKSSEGLNLAATYTANFAEDEELDITSYSGVYDAEGHSIVIENLFEGDLVEYSADGGATWSTTNPEFTNAKDESYTVMVKTTNSDFYDRSGSGTVTITPRAITITAGSASKRYNGEALTENSWKLTEGTLATGSAITSVTVTGSQLYKGSVDNVASDAVILVGGEIDATSNYEIIYVVGKLEVTTKGSKHKSTSTITTLNLEDHFAYIQGYPDGTVRPQGNVTREEVTAVFYRLLDSTYRESIKTTTENYNDVTENRWSAKHIGTLSNGEIINGYQDGSFRPGEKITRAELATVASRFDLLSAPDENKFSDITGHWAEKYILSAEDKGWVNGYVDGTFKPDQYITRAEFVTLVNNVLNRQVESEAILSNAKKFSDLAEGKWYYEDMMEAINSHNYERNDDGTEDWTEITFPSIEM